MHPGGSFEAELRISLAAVVKTTTNIRQVPSRLWFVFQTYVYRSAAARVLELGVTVSSMAPVGSLAVLETWLDVAALEFLFCI